VSRHTLTASALADHEDTRNFTSTPHSCRPGVDITIDYHPGFEEAALAALDAAYADVRAQISRRPEDQ
jgi:hypothetical protein